jgi:D-serine deaminase-like pyridoxal phosphate-dependent protein
MDLLRVERPVCIVDPVKARRNIERMAGKAAASGVDFRPHFKTHQSAAIGGWFRECGVGKIAVSSVDMAGYFAEAGWEEILIAVPANPHQAREIDALAGEIALHVILDSTETAEALAGSIRNRLSVWIETDTGYHRTGVPIEDIERLAAIAGRIRRAPHLSLEGLLVHDGHTYGATGPDGVRAVFETSRVLLAEALAGLDARGFRWLKLSIGDTPTCSLADAFPPPITEIRPGNFVFFDLTQAGLGSCTPADIAAAVACPVISRHPERGEVVLYGGGVHISKESLRLPDGSACFGRICGMNEGGLSWGEPMADASLVSLSQEQGIVRGPAAFIESVAIGDTLVVLPVHSCLTANLHGELMVLGQGPVSKFRL